MSRKTRSRKRHAKPGTSPGAFVIDPQAPKPAVRVMAYGPQALEEQPVADVAKLCDLVGKWPVVWVDVDGLGDAAVLRQVGAAFGLHPLALEDVVHVGQRPKVDFYDEHLFVVLRMPNAQRADLFEQVSLFIGKNYVLTFQQTPGDCFDPVRERVRDAQGRMRRSGPDYLAYALIDATIDAYFPLLERLGDRLDAVESEIFAKADSQTPSRIQELKSVLREVRRASWPHRDVANVLLRQDTPFIAEGTRVYLRDCADHAAHVADLVDTYREMTMDLMSAYLSTVSNRLNEVMKVLTIITSIFIPLSFIAGIYGMNFDREASRFSMPELGWAWGYPAVLLVMLGIAAGLLVVFRRKGWLG